MRSEIKEYFQVSRSVLDDFGSRMRLATAWWELETLESISFSGRAASENAQRITLDLLHALRNQFGSAIELRFSLDGFVALDFASAPSQQDIDRLLGLLKDQPDVEIRIRLDKTELLRQRLASDYEIGTYLFLFPGSLRRHLVETSLSDLEYLWRDSEISRVTLLAPGEQISCEGPLVFFDGDSNTLPIGGRRNVRSESLDVTTVSSWALRNLKWEKPWARVLTPFHFGFDTIGIRDRNLEIALVYLQCKLFMVYSADRSYRLLETGSNASPRAEGVAASFVGSHSSLDLTIDGRLESVAWPESGDGDLLRWSNSLVSTLESAYDPRIMAVGVALLQSAVVHALSPYLDPSQRSARILSLLSRVDRIEADFNIRLKSFLNDELDTYVGKIQDLETSVQTAVTEVSKEISGIVKSLSDTVLAAVGVLIGTVVASLFRESISEQVFKIGLTTYALYVLIFPFLLGLSQTQGRYEEILENFGERRRSYQQFLTSDTVSEIADRSINRSHSRYVKWLVLAALFYGALLLAILMLVLAGPESLGIRPVAGK